MFKERFIPKGAVKVSALKSPAFAFVYCDPNGRPCAQVFPSEKAVKPGWNFRFQSAAHREKRVAEYFAGQAVRAAQKAKDAAARKAWVPDFKVGDILKGHWGYDQTNIDYFEVVAVKGKMLEIQQLAQARSGDGYGGSSKCVPLPGEYKNSKVYRVRAQQNGVKSPIYGWLYKEAPKMVGGVPVYEAAYWSNDH